MARRRINAAGFCRGRETEYMQAVVGCWAKEGLAAVAVGGGGGAAQLMPAALVREALLEGREQSLRATTGRDSILQLLEAMDASLGAVVRAPDKLYVGSSAQATVCGAFDDRLWFGNVGLGRAYRIDANDAVQLTRDDSLLQELVDSGASPAEIEAFPHRGIVTSVLGGGWANKEQGGHIVSCTIDAPCTYLLATEEAHADLPTPLLAEFVLEAMRSCPDLAAAAESLWMEMRRHHEKEHSGPEWELAGRLARFDRRAAFLLFQIG